MLVPMIIGTNVLVFVMGLFSVGATIVLSGRKAHALRKTALKKQKKGWGRLKKEFVQKDQTKVLPLNEKKDGDENATSLKNIFKEKAKIIIDTNVLEHGKKGTFLSAASLVNKIDADRLKAREFLRAKQHFHENLNEQKQKLKKRIRKKLENRNNYLENERLCFLEESSSKLAKLLDADEVSMPSICNSLKGILHCKKNSIIYGEQDLANKMYIITKGNVKIISESNTRVLQRHDLFGIEMISAAKAANSKPEVDEDGNVELPTRKDHTYAHGTDVELLYMDYEQLVFFYKSGLLKKGQARTLSLIQKLVLERTRRLKMKNDNLLQEVEVFKNLDKEKLDKIIDSMVLVSFRPGDFIIKEDDLALDFFVIVKGEVKVLKNNVGEITTKCSHDVFGENALSVQKEKALRSASIKATIHTDCYKLSRSKLKILVKENVLSEEELMKFQASLRTAYE